MAQYRLSMTAVSRGTGRKIVAVAAYRSGEKLDDRQHGESQDYSHRGGVLYSEIVLPDNAPEWATDRAELWNRVEEAEKRADTTLAREVLLSLPCELSDAQRVELVQEFAQHVATEYGLAVDMNLHAPSEAGDDRNHHAHLLIASRGFDDERENGWSKTKDRRFNAVEMQKQGRENAVSEMREAWEQIQNRALERADIRDERGELVQVDRRSYEAQGLEIEPTQHLGYAATGMQRRGEDSDRAAVNDNIRQGNEADRQPDDRAETRREVEAVKLEMSELFEEIANRPGAALQFKRRERELAALHTEAEELLNPPDRRASDRMNDLLLSGPGDVDSLDRLPREPWRWKGLDEFNRELTEPVEDDRGRDTDKGKGKEIIANTFPQPDDDEQITRPAPSWGYGRSR